MFEPDASWSLPAHLYMVSEWSAKCSDPDEAVHSARAPPDPTRPTGSSTVCLDRPHLPAAQVRRELALLHVQGQRARLREQHASMSCKPVEQRPKDAQHLEPACPRSPTSPDGQRGDIQSLNRFFDATRAGRLPSVSWIVPNHCVSEHPPSLVSAGQTYVTGLINTIMQSPDWNSTAIFLAWDDWGGFYDQVVPPAVDANGYGLRVPGIVISPYANAATSTTRSSASTPTTSSSRTTSSTGSGSTRDRRPAGSPARRAGGASVAGQPGPRLRLLPAAAGRPVILPVCPATDLQPPPSC